MGNAREIKLKVGDNTFLIVVLQEAGSITSTLKDFMLMDDGSEEERLRGSIDAIESLVLGHACAGIDVEDPKYIAGLQTTIDAISNNNF
jgi:hypothetical protein